MPATITLTGWKEFEAKAKNMTAELLDELDMEVEEAANNWVDRAMNDAPVDMGFLKNGIKKQAVQKGIWEVTSNAEYSPYMEWGTRQRVSVPTDLAAYAITFKGQGSKGGDVKAMIYEWCRRKGIPEDKWWPIFISIMVKGVNPHPFFFIQYPFVEAEFFNHVKNILETEH